MLKLLFTHKMPILRQGEEGTGWEREKGHLFFGDIGTANMLIP